MEKFKQLWSDWRGTVGFIGGALVVSTTFFTCSFQPNEEAIKDEVIETVLEPKAEQPEAVEAVEPKKEEEAPAPPSVIAPE